MIPSICEALLADATGFGADATVEVTTFSDAFDEEFRLATGSASDGCGTV